MTSNWLSERVKPVDRDAEERALRRQSQLTKPSGSLGQLEHLATRMAALQGRERPVVDKVRITVFAADHGVALEGVSAFPQAVTSQMLANFIGGGAAISVLAAQLGAGLEIVDTGIVNTDNDSGVTPRPGVRDCRVGNGTGNIRVQDAMSEEQLQNALQAGREAVERSAGADLFIGGDMGIANTTPATALGSALLAVDPEVLAGPGTGLNPDGVRHKSLIIREALNRYSWSGVPPLEVMRRLGGFEIAALTGAMLRGAQLGVPMLVDGFITTAAALAAVRHDPATKDWLIFSHRSAEPGHGLLLTAMQAEPLLDLSMRLGEGSGAAVAVPLLRMACSLHSGMATFAEAGVSEG
ncbi:MAG: nicotinate-nucleotide--dimethylbenzimidazole phosphoribosyltransferase [Gammaproteobacteria bacterium]|nr:nicotinate-nucleotide--dimethylbenzimidazole phosphoribosyltransferase [Gammaproteobacteria bacterium]